MPPSPEVILHSRPSHSLISQYLPTLAQTWAAGLAMSISMRTVAYSGSAATAAVDTASAASVIMNLFISAILVLSSRNLLGGRARRAVIGRPTGGLGIGQVEQHRVYLLNLAALDRKELGDQTIVGGGDTLALGAGL